MKLGKNTKRLNYIMLLFLFSVQALDNYCREISIGLRGLHYIKNGFLIIVTIFFLYEIFLLKSDNHGYSGIFFDEIKSIICLTVTFAILSIYFMLKNHGFERETMVGLIRIILPIIVAYTLLNVMDIDCIYSLMAILLIIMFIGYLAAFANEITISNILSIDFLNSYSPFESNYFSPAAMGFCLFFCYYRKNWVFTVLSVFFTIMTFKRIMVIYSLFLLIFGGIVKKLKKMSPFVIKIFVLGFILFSLFYIRLMDGTVEDLVFQYFGIHVNSFSMGRSYFMRVILRDFKSLGFMSSTVGYRSMEMDIPMVYVEMGILALIAIIYYMAKLVKDNWYSFLIILFCLLELLTSHWLDIIYFWIVAYITIGCIQYKSNDNKSNNRGKNKPKIKFVW